MKQLVAIAVPLMALSSCSRGGPGEAQVLRDFTAICEAQSHYASARDLMKSADPTEILGERNRRLGEAKLLTDGGMRAREALVGAGAGSAKDKVESAARSAGLKDWTCPAL